MIKKILASRWFVPVITIVLISAFGLFFWLGYSVDLYVDSLSKEQPTELHERGYRFISPLLECQSSASNNREISQLREGLNETVNSAIDNKVVSHVSIYFRDLNNGPWIGVNQNEKFSPASLMKVPIMISYLKLAELNHNLLNSKLKVTMSPVDAMSQNILPSEVIISGQEYTVEELIRRMIRYSDNLAANTLLQYGDLNLLDKTYEDLGVSVPEESEENFLSVRDYASFFRILYNSSYLNREMSELALQILSTAEYSEGIVAGVPSYITVAHKFGERRIESSLQLHDCGIVYRSDSPYLLCIMTRGNDFDKMKNVISDLSKQVFSFYKLNK